MANPPDIVQASSELDHVPESGEAGQTVNPFEVVIEIVTPLDADT